MAFAFGARGTFNVGTGLNYDLSAQRGSNKTDFYIRNTINASLGPQYAQDFVPAVRSKPKRFTTWTCPTASKWVSLPS